MAAISKEVSNYIKIALLVLRISPKAVRVKFDIEFHPERLRKTLDENFPELQELYRKKRILSKEQWNLLFPLNKKGEISSQNFDITLMILLIRNLTKITISSILPPPSQMGLGEDLSRIHFYRNKIAHVDDATISDAEFTKYWDDITQAIIRLGGEVLREMCSELQKQKFNVDESEDHLRQLQVEFRLAAVENKVMELTDKMSNLEEEQEDPIPKNVRVLINKQIEGWRTKDNCFFIKTKRSEYALQRVVENNCVVLTGGPGVGKTFIARHIALVLEGKGYRIIPVSKPKDIRKFYQQGKKSIFIVDDMCGKYTANQREMENWQQFSMVIKTILEDESCKIILSCRLQIYLDERFKLLSPFQNCECNLMAKRLRTKEIKQMIEQYNISTKVLSMESRKCECFPLLCALHHENERVDTMDFFKNPFEIYRTELDNLGIFSFDSKCKLCGLALCVLFNNSIEEKWFQSKVEDDEKTMLQDVFGKCGLNSGTSKDSIGKAFRTLDGTYVCKQNGVYTISHDTFFDFLVYYFGQKMCQCLIEHGNSNLIRERFKWGKSNMFSNIEFITVIPDHHALKLFMDRLIKDWIEGKVSNVFHNINLQFTDFRVQFVQYLEQLDKNYQVKLANSKDTMCLEGDCSSGTYPLIDVCYHGYDDLLQWLLNNSVDVNKSRDDGVTPLIMASCYGILETVIKLLKQNPDVNLCNVENVTALYIACQNSHVLVVEQLLKIEDINVDLCNNHGQSPLFIACQRGLTAIVNNLLQKSPNVNQCSPFGLNPLHIACFLCYTDVVSLLLAAKNVNIDVNARDADGSTPLVFACFKNYTEISSLLISAGADVNIKAFSGASALCFAIGHGNLETTSLLLENNASLQTGFKNRQQIMDALSQNSERTLNEVQEEIRHFCVTYASQKVRDYVSEMSGDYCLDAMIDSSPLHIACFMGHTNIVECLLNLDAYIDFTKEDGTTPLFFACELGHADIVRLLLDKGADVNLRRLDGKSSSNIAEYNGHKSIVVMLMERGTD